MEDIYKMDNTYLLFEKSNKKACRWVSDKSIFFAGSEVDALEGLDNSFYAKKVSECSEELQKEYKKKIDELIKTGGL